MGLKFRNKVKEQDGKMALTEDRIKELEKENAELKAQVDKLKGEPVSGKASGKQEEKEEKPAEEEKKE